MFVSARAKELRLLVKFCQQRTSRATAAVFWWRKRRKEQRFRRLLQFRITKWATVVCVAFFGWWRNEQRLFVLHSSVDDEMSNGCLCCILQLMTKWATVVCVAFFSGWRNEQWLSVMPANAQHQKRIQRWVRGVSWPADPIWWIKWPVLGQYVIFKSNNI